MVDPTADALIAFVVILVLLAVTPDGASYVQYTAGLLTRGSMPSSPFPALSHQWKWKVARRSQSRGRLRFRCRDLVHRPHSRFSSNAFAPLSTVMTVSVRLGGSRSSTKPACLSSAAPNWFEICCCQHCTECNNSPQELLISWCGWFTAHLRECEQ